MTGRVSETRSGRTTGRKFFIGAGIAALGALAAAEWLRHAGIVGGALPLAAQFIDEGTQSQRGAIFRALVRAILPLEDARFPSLDVETIERRVNRLFQLEKSKLFRESLILFDHIGSFPFITNHPFTLDTRPGDVELYAGFIKSIGPEASNFTKLPLEAQRRYLRMWVLSATELKRRFYQSIKAVIMIATYSMDETWHVIGYAGPLLKQRPSKD